MGEQIRLQRLLSMAGLASRRQAEELIRAGRVRVNGERVTELGVRVDPAVDRVEVDGRLVEPARPVWIALHKPKGYVTTRRDPQGRPTIYDLLPPTFAGLFHVGRLDADSEGLLLLTNQGEVAHRLLHPRYGVDRVYEVEVAGRVTAATERRILEGIELEDGIARARALERVPGAPPGTTRLRVTMRDGRKRIVRRLLAAAGHPVRRLVRLSHGPVRLGRLRPGAWRRLTPAEVAALERFAAAQGE
ncbi:MAG TPA: pseudouridine synthase [Longimicrobiales bacterium]